MPRPNHDWERSHGGWSSHYQQPDPETTLKFFAEHDPLFRDACQEAGVQPTKRQASKWRRKLGKAYSTHRAKVMV